MLQAPAELGSSGPFLVSVLDAVAGDRQERVVGGNLVDVFLPALYFEDGNNYLSGR